jgi:hypothetical protein
MNKLAYLMEIGQIKCGRIYMFLNIENKIMQLIMIIFNLI